MGRARVDLEEAVAAVVYRAGLEPVLRRTVNRRKVGIIVYHDPTPERFESHLRFLAGRYRFVTLTELVSAVRSGDWSQMPENGLVITFDDGHRGNLELRSLFARYDVRPTIFLSTGSVFGDGMFWFLLPGVQPGRLKLLTPAEREAAVSVATALGEPPVERHALTPEEVTALAELAEFGSHTVSHPILPLCSDEEATDEIVRSRREVGELTGAPCLHFCFPNGDYGKRELDLVDAAGYASARTTDVGWNGPGSDPLRLRIVSGADHASVAMLATHLTGLLRFRRLLADRRLRRRLAARVASLGRSAP
jgi:peptidoglycan/xylan/chitin deacetylase (PgdA/CDA1 family)